MAATADLAFYKDSLIVLATAAVVVPVMHRLNVTPVIGYLAAGALLGPFGLGALAGTYPWLSTLTFENEKDLAQFAELGVVFLLFVIGLELSVERLSTMRRYVFGLGTLQVVISGIAIGLIAPIFGHSVAASTLIGLCLALSSTAMVLDNLALRKRLTTAVGRTSFAVLLLQDLAVIPMLFLVGILGANNQGPVGLGLLIAFIQGAATLGLIVVAGRMLLRPMFKLVSATGGTDLFMAAALLVAVGTGVLTAAAGLSMALGGFVAGLLLAETEYRKAVEAVIEPFKGLLLGVFFITVGARVDLATLLAEPLYLLFNAAGLVLLKAAIVIPLARLYGLTWPAAVEMGLLLGPGGEFAFILIGLGVAGGVIAPEIAGVLLVVVALTMAVIPVLGWLGEKIGPWLGGQQQGIGSDLETAPLHSEGVAAIVVGAGRVGRLVSQMLTEHGVDHVITDYYASAVVNARNDGMPAYFGDAKNADFLERCGIKTAQAVIVTINGQAEIDEVVDVARRLNPNLQIIARAKDASHARHLYSHGVTDAVPETIEASLQLSEAALVALRVPAGPAIASIHEKRDEFRRELQAASKQDDRQIRGLRGSARQKR